MTKRIGVLTYTPPGGKPFVIGEAEIEPQNPELEKLKKAALEFGKRVAEAEDAEDRKGRRLARVEWSAFWKDHWGTENHDDILSAYNDGYCG